MQAGAFAFAGEFRPDLTIRGPLPTFIRMAAKLLSASLSLIWLYLLHCPEARASTLFQRLEKAKPAFECGSGLKSQCKGAPAAGPFSVILPSRSPFLREGPGTVTFPSSEKLSSARAFLIRTGLSPPFVRS